MKRCRVETSEGPSFELVEGQTRNEAIILGARHEKNR